jgi:uncharacterized protein (DUF427 family)
MKAVLKGKVIAESDDIVHGYDIVHERSYAYFPPAHVQLDLLEKTPRTESDLACPHGVQFYDVIVDGTRYERAAWIYEAPRGDLTPVAGRVGFWKSVEVG